MPEKSLSSVMVKDVQHLIVENPSILTTEASISDLLDKIVEDTRSRHVYVVDAENQLVGSVRLNNTLEYLFPTITLIDNLERPHISSFLDYSSAKKVADIMNPNPFFVYKETMLSETIKIMVREQVNELPVIDSKKKIIGEVNVLEIITYYRNIE